ncbi:hypothetical protein OU995_12495 [Roseateles sp. SL47]|uniref:hypothetical protein n=1 Tax=Roseateles sp. SL47 TaxID=2995138 RepID=UPI002271C698|nr:hypothetical protein [Roseateles sp. SL47]WAC75463.1 hypothetical protein OU995_12495 [Roseateles sp. SL47]
MTVPALAPLHLLLLMGMGAVVAHLTARWLKMPLNLKSAMRWGMGMSFFITGLDHFLSADRHSLALIPDALAAHDRLWVHLAGVAELLGGLALVLPMRFYRRTGVPNLQIPAGLGLMVMLASLLLAHLHALARSLSSLAPPMDAWTRWSRVLLPTMLIGWGLYALDLRPRHQHTIQE